MLHTVLNVYRESSRGSRCVINSLLVGYNIPANPEAHQIGRNTQIVS